MPIPDSGLRRIAVHTATAHADLTLPSGVPVATLIPVIADLLPGPADRPSLLPYRLGEPGMPALDGTKTLAQQGVRDGSVLVLTRSDYADPPVRFTDPIEQVAANVQAVARPWSPVARRLTAALAASGLAGVAGFVAVPGGPGTPNALLAVAAAATVALVFVPPSGCDAPVRTTLCCLAGLALLAAVAGLAAAMTGVPLSRLGAVSAAAGVGLSRVAGRIAGQATGLSRRLEPTAVQAGAAHDLLTGLVAAAAALVALGALASVAGAPVAGAPPGVGVAFATVAGAALALRAGSHRDGAQIAALLIGGTTAVGIALLAAGFGADVGAARLWPAAVAVTLAGAVIGHGFTVSAPPPLARRIAEVVEALALGALVPLAGWLCGVYGAAGGLFPG
ncbi:EsaB/YukD family protein [Mycolicibacter minnesotensis]